MNFKFYLLIILFNCYISLLIFWSTICWITNHLKPGSLRNIISQFLSLGMQNSLAGWFWFRGSQQVTVKMSSRAASVSKVLIGTEEVTPGGLLTWLLAGGLQFLTMGICIHLSVSSSYGIWLLPEWVVQERGWSHTIFYDLVPAHSRFHSVSLEASL